MRTNLKMILSAVGVAALLASPAIAKTVRHHQAAPSSVYIPGDARGAVVPYGTYGSYGYDGSYGPYAPNAPTPAYGKSNDFQGGGGDRG